MTVTLYEAMQSRLDQIQRVKTSGIVGGLRMIKDADEIETIRTSMCELPSARRSRFVDSLSLSDYDAVALCGVGEITPAVASSLADFVEKGGGFFVVLGSGWGPSIYTPLTDAGLFPSRSSDDAGKSPASVKGV